MLTQSRIRFVFFLLFAVDVVVALLNSGCKCHPLLPPHEPIRVVLLEPYQVGGTFTGAGQFDWYRSPAIPSCNDVDGLAEASSVVVPGDIYHGGEACHVNAPITIDVPVAITEPMPHPYSLHSPATYATFHESVPTTLAGCYGAWTYGLFPIPEPGDGDAGIAANGDPFRDPVPGRDPPWVVIRGFESTASCPAIPGFDGAGNQCVDIFAARIERVNAP